MRTHRLFVYGSLKRGFSNHHFLHGQRFIAEALTSPNYRMYDYGGFPAVVPVIENGISIEGELWEISEDCLDAIDVLECVAEGLYERAETQLLPPNDQFGDVILYQYLRDVSELPDVGTGWSTSRDIRR